MRLTHNACVDELRRGRTRAVGDVELDGMPAMAAQLPDELTRRAEARALIGDIHRLPERQRHVLVMSALDGLSHEEVAGRLDTTVETTRSLLARARENLRRTAAARETACQAVCDALDEAAASRVRASEIARRHLWSCADCRSYQRDLRAAPRRLRRLAAWSPWGIVAQLAGGGGAATVQKVAVGACCAIVGVGGAVAVPEIAVHSGQLPEITASVPVPVAPEPALRPQRDKRAATSPVPAAPVPVVAPSTAVARVAVTPSTPRAKTKPRTSTTTPRRAHAASLKRNEYRALSKAMCKFLNTNPSQADRKAMFELMRKFRGTRPGSPDRMLALAAMEKRAREQKYTPPPAKGIATPAPHAGQARSDGHAGAAAADPDRSGADARAGRHGDPDARPRRDPHGRPDGRRHPDALNASARPAPASRARLRCGAAARRHGRRPAARPHRNLAASARASSAVLAGAILAVTVVAFTCSVSVGPGFGAEDCALGRRVSALAPDAPLRSITT